MICKSKATLSKQLIFHKRQVFSTVAQVHPARYYKYT